MSGASLAQGWRAIKQGFRATYDYAGTVMIISTIWFFLGMGLAWYVGLLIVLEPLNLLGHLIFGIICVFLLGPLTVAVYSVCAAVLNGEEVPLRKYLSHFTRHYKKAALATMVMMIIIGVLIIDVLFFWQAGTAIMQLISVLWIYLILFWVMMMQYVYGLIVLRNPRLWENLKMSALLGLDNLVVTFMIILAVALVMGVSYFLRVPIMLFMVGTIGFLHIATLNELLSKYSAAKEK